MINAFESALRRICTAGEDELERAISYGREVLAAYDNPHPEDAELIRGKTPIEAIKALRAKHCEGLMESKARYDSLMRGKV